VSDQAESLRQRVKAQRALRLGLWAGAGVDGATLASLLTEAIGLMTADGGRVELVGREQGVEASIVATRSDPESLAAAYAALGSEGRQGPVALLLVAARGYPGGARAAAAVRATAWKFRQVRVVELGTLPGGGAEALAGEARTALATAARRLCAIEWETEA
jgi:hypothetical protein